MKKLISLLTVLFLFVIAVPVFADNPQIEKFAVRWVNGTNQFEVLAVVNIANVISEDFFFSWSASGTPIQAVSHYGGRAKLSDGKIRNGKWIFTITGYNKYNFLALQFQGVARENKKFSEKFFNLLPAGKQIYPRPYIPNNPLPADQATSQTEVVVSWSGGDPNGLPISYTVLWGYSSTGNQFQVVTKDTFLVLANWKKFPYDKEFYWKVIADNGFQKVAGPTWKFDTYTGKSLTLTSENIFQTTNYPNPFNPVTTISYKLDQAADVQLTIYNSLGQQVAILVNHHQPSGDYAVKFDASNLASGTYFYRLKVGQKILIKRMFLLK